jgi:thiol-disulfide isomerase/thioredoxin
MRNVIRTCGFLIAACLLIQSQAVAQEPFKNPAVDQQDEFQQVFTQARALLRQGQVDEAIKEFRHAAKLHNDQCVECFSFIGQTYLRLAKYKDAAIAFRQGAELKSDIEAEMYNALGIALYLQNDKKLLDEAAAAFKRSIELSNGKAVKAYYNLGFALIKKGKESEGVAALKTYLEKDPEANAAEVKAIIANPRMAGEKFAIAFSVKSSKGAELSLDKLKGKIVLLDFWASWCGPCRAEMPEVKRIWKKYGGDSFVIVGINLDSNRNSFESYVKQEEVVWPQYYDGMGWNNKIARLYNVHAIPQTILIDQDGVIRAMGLRGGALYDKIGDLLKRVQK